MYEYKPTIKDNDFTDVIEPKEVSTKQRLTLARSTGDRLATNQVDEKYCSVRKLWLETPGKKDPQDRALRQKEVVESKSSRRWHFAPKEEKLKICWELKGLVASEGSALANEVELKLELFTRSEATPFWTKTMKWKAGECLKQGETEFDGLLNEDLYKSAKGKTKETDEVTIKWHKKDKFPDGILTVDNSPYKVKLSIVNAGEKRHIVARWVYLEVLVDSLELEWGDYSMLPNVRPDITEPKNLKKILGHQRNPLDVTDVDIKGYEETILDELKLANPKPVEGVVHQVKLTSNLFAFQKKQANNIESYETNTDFESYKALWGKGARIPLLVKAFIKKSVEGQKTDQVPEALGKSKILWDWDEKKADRWKDAVNGGAAPKTEPFLNEGYKKNDPVKPEAKSNCPHEYGGKHGVYSADELVIPEQAITPEFPFKVVKSAGRKWSSLSSFGTADQRGVSGAIFQPARFAGDSYKIKAYLHFDHYADSEDDIQAPPPVQTKACEFKVFRRIHLNSLVRGRASLNSPPAGLETILKTDYLKELDMVVEVNPTDVDNNAYKAALLKAIDRVCAKKHFVDEVEDITNLSLIARFAVETDPPADSAAVVFRDWNEITDDLTQKFEAGVLRVIGNLPNFYPGEDITGQTSHTTGTLLKIGNRQFVLYPSGAAFTPNEQVTGNSSKLLAPITLSGKSCKEHTCKLTPQTERNNKIYKESVEVEFPNGTKVSVNYKKSGFMLTLSPDLSETAKIDLRREFAVAWTAHNETNTFDIKVYGRNDTDNAKARFNNIKLFFKGIFEADTILDRKMIREQVLKELKKAFTVPLAKDTQDMISLLLLGETVWEYAKQQHPDKEGIFLLHVPGQYKGYTFEKEDSNDQIAAKMPKVQGAFYPELTGEGNSKPLTTRDRTVVYLATVPDIEALPVETKTIPSIFKHELAHALFLPHSLFRTGRITPSPRPQCHVKEDKCLMNYDLDTEHFCGMCMIRMRGWNWQANPLQNQVAKVHILSGDKNTYLAANGVQYVNLPVEDKWVEGVNILNKDRLGRKLKIKVEFQQEIAGQNVKVQLLADQNNVVYSGTEKTARAAFNFVRNPAVVPSGNFNQDQGPVVTGQTDKDGNFFAEVELGPAVGDQYKVVAWDDFNNRVESVEIITWRAVYYMTLQAGTVPNSVPRPTFCTQLETTYRNVFTRMIDLGSETLPGVIYLDTAPSNDFKAIIKSKLALPSALTGRPYVDYQPFLAQICFADQIFQGFRKTKEIPGTRGGILKVPGWTLPIQAPIGIGQPNVQVPIKFNNPPMTDPTADMRKPLWLGLGDPASEVDLAEGESGIDRRNVTVQEGWFINAIARLPNGTEIPIPKANCTPIQQDSINRPGYCMDVSVRVDNLGVNDPNATILLDVVYINRAPDGQAQINGLPGYFAGQARYFWLNNPHNEQIAALMHELGHSLGMVAATKETGLDPHGNQYNEGGNHCHFGIPQRADNAYNKSDPNHLNMAQCLMFGQVCNPPQYDFCVDCQGVMRKIDISGGLL